MSQWADVPFADLLVETKDGEWGEGAETVGHQLCEVIRGTDFAELHAANKALPLRWIPDNLVDRKRLQPGDILLETAGGTAKQSTGRTALLGERFFEQRFCPTLCSSFVRHLRLDQGRCDPAFLYYLLQALYAAGYMGVFNLQHTGISRFQFTSFKNKTKLSMPPKTTQTKIAAILSAYDDLIANNQRRITLLQSMAEEIYREWFARMRFPGHQGVSKEKGLPFGWSFKPFAQVVEINPSERPAKEDEHPFVAMDELSVDSMYFSTKVRRKGNSGSRFRNSDVLFPRITPSLENGKRGFVMCLEEDEVAIGSTEFIVMREHEISAEHIYFLTCSDDFRKHAEISMVGASGRQRVNEGCFSFFLVAVPPERERSAFTHTVRPMFVEIGNLAKQNALLESTRDALLPRLISGKLKVDHLDIQLPPSMREKVTA